MSPVPLPFNPLPLNVSGRCPLHWENRKRKMCMVIEILIVSHFVCQMSSVTEMGLTQHFIIKGLKQLLKSFFPVQLPWIKIVLIPRQCRFCFSHLAFVFTSIFLPYLRCWRQEASTWTWAPELNRAELNWIELNRAELSCVEVCPVGLLEMRGHERLFLGLFCQRRKAEKRQARHGSSEVTSKWPGVFPPGTAPCHRLPTVLVLVSLP